MIGEKEYQQIEDYLGAKLTEQEFRSFEKRLEEDPALKEEVSLHRQAQKVLDYGVYLKAKERLTRIEKELYPTRKTLFKSLAIAAGILLIIGFSGWLWLSTAYNESVLAGKYFATSEMELQRGDIQQIRIPTNELFLQAQDFFESGDYQNAIKIYTQLSELDTDLRPKAEWNLVITRMADGQCNQDCLQQLRDIADNKQHPYNTRAIDLLAKRQSMFFRLAN